MPRYYVNDNAQPLSGDHEVHVEGCSWLGLVVSKTDLGIFNSCAEAVTAAKKKYSDCNGCKTCSPACHTT